VTGSPIKKFQSSIDSNLNQLAFLAFGVALLLPWNATMATMAFFIERFPNYSPSFSFLVAVSIPMLFMQIVAFTGVLP